jgi:peptidoglycan/LPS O-acetylase OafA/YrhL
VTDHSADRILYLDALRGLAALAVAIFWHYQTFDFPFQLRSLPLERAPLFALPVANLLYRQGYLAVDLFFMISGMVFQRVYAERIGAGLPARRFFLLRFSRLYPAHLATLLLSAALVWSFQARFDRLPNFLTHDNDAYHFGLNLLFLQDGFFNRGPSFNGAAWSLSIEAFLYAWFYWVARRRAGIGWISAFIMLGIALWASGVNLTFLLNQDIARGIVGFFTGVLIARLTGRRRTTYALMALYPLAFAALALATFIFPPSREFPLRLAYPAAWFAFGSALIALQAWPILQRPLTWRPLTVLGDLSLSVYLVHTPVAMAILFAIYAMGAEIPFASAGFLLGYAAAVLAAAAMLHFGLERPARRWLRRRFAGEPARPGQARMGARA